VEERAATCSADRMISKCTFQRWFCDRRCETSTATRGEASGPSVAIPSLAKSPVPHDLEREVDLC
jgi:hypothetical protein